MTVEKMIKEQLSAIVNSAKRLLIQLDTKELKHLVILAILLKYLSERFYEKHTEILQTHCPEELELVINNPSAYFPTFYLDQRVLWSYLINQPNHVYNLFKDAIYYIEKHHPDLHELSRLLPVHKEQFTDNTFKGFLSIIDKLNLFLYSGLLFDLLLQKFADEAGTKGGEFYTPPTVSKLLVSLLNPQNGMSVYDPTARSGGMLVQSLNKVLAQNNSNHPLSLDLYGQELNFFHAIIAKINLLMNGMIHINIETGDVLAEPKYTLKTKKLDTSRTWYQGQNTELKKFDIVVSHIPFSQKINLPREELYSDIYNRFSYGVPNKNNSTYAFLMHMIASTKDNGKIGAVMPQGVLFRGNYEKEIRQRLIEQDLIEAIIGLPPGLLYGTNTPICLFILNKNKSTYQRRKILFIDASNHFKTTRLMNKLQKEEITKIIQTYISFQSNGTYSKVVSFEEIEQNHFDLSIRKYVDDSDTSKKIKELLKLHADFQTYSFSDKQLISSISIPYKQDDIKSGNVIYLHRFSSSQRVKIELQGSEKRLDLYFCIEFNPNLLLKDYAKLYFESELGKLVLSNLPNGANLPGLSKELVESLQIPVPSIALQIEVCKIASKLTLAKQQINTFSSQLTTDPKQYENIEKSTNTLIYSLSSLNNADHLMQLIAMGENRHMEFKQSFFANIDKINSQEKINKDRDVQGEIIKVIASFMNTDGGTLLIGVNDHGKITGVENEMAKFNFKKTDNYFQELGAQLSSRLNKDYLQYCSIVETIIEEKSVIQIICKPTPFPVFVDNEKFHIRTDSSSPALTGAEMLRYIQHKFNLLS